MRILLTVHQFFPDYSAGTEVLTLSVAKRLISFGHEVHIFSGYPGKENIKNDERFDKYVYDGINISRFHHAYVPMYGQQSMIEVGYKNLLALHFFKKIVKQFQPDCVHHFHLNRLGVGLIDYLNQKEIPQFFTPTDFWMICPTAQLMLEEGHYCEGPDINAGNCVKHFACDKLKQVPGNIINKIPVAVFDKLAHVTKSYPIIHYPMSKEVRALNGRLQNTISSLNKLDGIISPNAFITDLFIKYGVKEELIHNCHFGVDINPIETSQTYLHTKRKLCIGFIGTLAPHKGCHITIKAIQKLPTDSVNFKIYGSSKDFPDYYNSLIKLAENNPNIEFCGTFPNDKIGEIIAQFDVLVVPSVWYENTPLVIYSAQACKCPVIASNLPGISEVIKNGENGLLFEAGNFSELALHISELLANSERLLAFRNKCNLPLSIEQYTLKLLDIWHNY